jgi:hypothetical protein
MLENNRGGVNNFLICKPYEKPKTAVRAGSGPLAQKVARAELIRLEVLVNGTIIEGPQRTAGLWPGCFIYVRADRYFVGAAKEPLFAEGLEIPAVDGKPAAPIQFVVINGGDVVMVELNPRKT